MEVTDMVEAEVMDMVEEEEMEEEEAGRFSIIVRQKMAEVEVGVD